MDGSPLLLIDIDGVISLWGFDPQHRPPGTFCQIDGQPHFLSHGAAERLQRLARTFRCVWCSGWEDRADTHLPHLLGLPTGWPHLMFDGTPAAPGKRHWKLAAIEAHAGPDCPVAWIDDAHDGTCHTWAAGRPGPTLLIRTDPSSGLLDEHVEALQTWAAGLPA